MVQRWNAAGKVLAYHDRSDGGLLATLCEMAFAARAGLDIALGAIIVAAVVVDRRCDVGAGSPHGCEGVFEVGLVVDSIVFLYLAFGSLDFLLGQVLGKAWMVLLALPFVRWLNAG